MTDSTRARRGTVTAGNLTITGFMLLDDTCRNEGTGSTRRHHQEMRKNYAGIDRPN